MRALSVLNISAHCKLNLHAVLLRLISLLLFGEQNLSFDSEQSSVAPFACLLSGQADSHSRAESLICYEENITKADEPTKTCVISDISSKLSLCQSFFFWTCDTTCQNCSSFSNFWKIKSYIFRRKCCFFSHFKCFTYTFIKPEILLIWERMCIILSQFHFLP